MSETLHGLGDQFEKVTRKTDSDLVRYFKKRGDLKEVRKAEFYQARQLYVEDQLEPEEVAKFLKIPAAMVLTWVFEFGWEELRARRKGIYFRDVDRILRARGESLDVDHDTMAHSLEFALKRALTRHNDPEDEFELSVKELSMLSKAIKETQSVRRLAHGRETKKEAQSVQHSHLHLELQEEHEQVAKLLDSTFNTPALMDSDHKDPISAPNIDAEFEVRED